MLRIDSAGSCIYRVEISPLLTVVLESKAAELHIQARSYLFSQLLYSKRFLNEIQAALV